MMKASMVLLLSDMVKGLFTMYLFTLSLYVLYVVTRKNFLISFISLTILIVLTYNSISVLPYRFGNFKTIRIF